MPLTCLIAMQKVVGSNPISRFPANRRLSGAGLLLTAPSFSRYFGHECMEWRGQPALLLRQRPVLRGHRPRPHATAARRPGEEGRRHPRLTAAGAPAPSRRSRGLGVHRAEQTETTRRGRSRSPGPVRRCGPRSSSPEARTTAVSSRIVPVASRPRSAPSTSITSLPSCSEGSSLGGAEGRSPVPRRPVLPRLPTGGRRWPRVPTRAHVARRVRPRRPGRLGRPHWEPTVADPGRPTPEGARGRAGSDEVVGWPRSSVAAGRI